MSLHAQMTQEAQAALAAQKRNSTVSSLIIAILSLFLIGLILFIVALTVEVKNPPEIISYSAGVEDTEEIEKPEMSSEVERKPSSPSSSMAKVIAANTASPTAVPVPDIEVTEPSLDFGNGDDFGDGWGDGDGWGGGGGGGGGASFFKQKVKAERIAFVIDYSMSMSGKRISLLKKELARSVGALPETMEYQLIFFAGPAWVAGSEVKMAQNRRSAVVSHNGRDYKWEGKGANNWETKGSKLRSPAWMKATKENLDASLSAIQSTALVYGTAWEIPLEMALDMKPQPEVIFFMTDGVSGGESERIAKRVAQRAKRKDIKINAIAMMDPSARDAMGALAEITGGQFSMVNKSGKTQVLIKGKEEE
ncbi:vWA domain-containing protein [Rubritalea tangerina]|uniref:VWFA domain-containing protein n=1 Tax=Rubritalea tangerina TaxID=430798 RepID=A0ABW4ZFF4_9BACT